MVVESCFRFMDRFYSALQDVFSKTFYIIALRVVAESSVKQHHLKDKIILGFVVRILLKLSSVVRLNHAAAKQIFQTRLVREYWSVVTPK